MFLANIIAAQQDTLWEEQDESDTDNADSLEFLYESEEENEGNSNTRKSSSTLTINLCLSPLRPSGFKNPCPSRPARR